MLYEQVIKMCVLFVSAYDQVQIPAVHPQQAKVQNCGERGDGELTPARVLRRRNMQNCSYVIFHQIQFYFKCS